MTRRTVSVHWILPRNDEVQTNARHLILDEPAVLTPQAALAGASSRDRWLGISGLIVVGAILGSGVYSIVRYLW